MMAKAKLSDDAKTYVVQALACFDSPSEVAEAVRKEFGVEITKQSVEAYDPTKVAGKGLAKTLKAIFEATREAFLKEISSIPIAHRAVRLRALQRMLEKAEKVGNIALVVQITVEAEKIVGEIYTNKRQLTGANGKPLFPRTITPEMTPQQAANIYAASLAERNEEWAADR